MAGRPPKKGIDYAGWSVDIFDNDTKIDKLLEARGWEGFGIYFYLCQRAYGGEGYFYRWSYDDSGDALHGPDGTEESYIPYLDALRTELGNTLVRFLNGETVD